MSIHLAFILYASGITVSALLMIQASRYQQREAETMARLSLIQGVKTSGRVKVAR